MSGTAATSISRGDYRLSITDLVSYVIDDEDGVDDLDESLENGYRQELEELAPEIDPLVDAFYGDNEEALASNADSLLLPELSFSAAELYAMVDSPEVLSLPEGFEQASLCVRFLLLEEYNKRCLEIFLIQTGPLPLAALATLTMDVDQLLVRYLNAKKEEPLH
ncbi:MAG: hypothetical protein KKD73_11195 [Proteobacteria bacterium]|nr:hypothetical protein [Pseudomonadota bacterium]MBU1641246.1 hypothetical protein [Pseudomonadota bacterium]